MFPKTKVAFKPVTVLFPRCQTLYISLVRAPLAISSGVAAAQSVMYLSSRSGTAVDTRRMVRRSSCLVVRPRSRSDLMGPESRTTVFAAQTSPENGHFEVICTVESSFCFVIVVHSDE